VGATVREVLSDLKRAKAVHLEVKGKQYLARTELSGRAYRDSGWLGWRCRRGRWPCSGYVCLIAWKVPSQAKSLSRSVKLGTTLYLWGKGLDPTPLIPY